MRLTRLTALMLFPWLLLSCSAVPVDHYAGQTPKLDIMAYFKGDTQAWGQFQDRSGKVIRRFQVAITGSVSQQDGQRQLTLDERFVYDDGEKQTRVWKITETAPFVYTGTAGDVIGQAHGKAAGPALNWAYTLDLPYKDGSIHVQFDDWMFLQDAHTLINRATVTKWGFKVGEVTLFFRKSNHAKADSA
ncbi:DUF3833 domain-containing protein [Thiomicrospira sp. WB1]|uniref:DUF3833 domain-containing protein n=1 Tax=Thiomicrospira sp. WB1 TaxID=1685380 RepID=UPI000748D65E|nr:DUF3833 domain-containing protein [Thiomicrospira sp. WB1]KUJ72484.1 hypothetical protein AVO41_01335 [Thiomicrospira sp. WB1]